MARSCSKLLGEEDEQIENKPTKKKLAESCEFLVLSLRRLLGWGSVKENVMQKMAKSRIRITADVAESE